MLKCKNLMPLFKNIRFYILIFSFSLSLFFYFWVGRTIPDGSLRPIRLGEFYALTAAVYLYVVLLIGPAVYSFKFLPWRGQIFKARRALGISVFYFGLLHAYIEFFQQLGGFSGLGFLDNKYLLAITLSSSALFILSLMAATSFDFMVRKLTFTKWKILHRFVYLAAIFILIHALLLGTHFTDLSTLIPQIFFGAIAVLLILEANRFDAFLAGKFVNLPKFGLTLTVVIVAITTYFVYSFLPNSGNLSLNIHAQHILLAQQAQNQNGQQLPANLANIPGLQGDRTKRYTVSFNPPQNIKPNVDTTLNFQVFDASSGNPVEFYNVVWEKVVHMIVVDSQLTYFTHIHPTQDSNGFSIATQFPKDGVYHIYLDFQPKGAIEQQFAFILNVGNVQAANASSFQPDTNFVKTFGNYEVTLAAPNPLKAEQLSVGQQTLTFTIRDAVTKQPITTLKPYLAAFGHLVAINRDTFDYLHVHPTNLTAPQPDANGGPSVDFIPLGLYGPIKAGIYRVFAQFNPDGKLFVADFTVKVE
ncbi:MAG TPA: ferric reductase-like transmembrane domain-containing protein [Candidatus Saccharimonadales bacterium]|nr:ferric reductase-like transmembrane domain-containing protein [Candidatus Saccharimonadales bacterium]